jgi:hypothetical protein
MKIAESIRQCEGNNTIIRLLKQPYDIRWVSPHDTVKKYVVVRYSSNDDKYIPVKDNSTKYWDDNTYNELDKSNTGTDKQKNMNRLNKARSKIRNSVGLNKFFTDDFKTAQEKYIKWSLVFCDITKSLWTVSNTGD